MIKVKIFYSLSSDYDRSYAGEQVEFQMLPRIGEKVVISSGKALVIDVRHYACAPLFIPEIHLYVTNCS